MLARERNNTYLDGSWSPAVIRFTHVSSALALVDSRYTLLASLMEKREDFVDPVMTGPLDVDAYVALVQPGATVKGMQFQALLDECGAHGRPIAGRRYVAFRDYPGTEFVELLALTAERVWPDQPPREGLRRLGRIAYPTLRRSLLGKVLFGALGNDVPKLWTLITKGYALSGSTGKATVLELESLAVIVRLEDMYSFIDAWHVGILEGAVIAYESMPTVKIRKLTPTSADFWIRWIPRQ